jgi:hypothetical protein
MATSALVDEIDNLLDHVGLDKQKVATDDRAKKVLGPELTKRVDQLAGKRLKIKRSQLRIDDHLDPRSGEWRFIIEANIPGFKDPPLLADGGVDVDANGLLRGGPDFRIEWPCGNVWPGGEHIWSQAIGLEVDLAGKDGELRCRRSTWSRTTSSRRMT